MTPRSFAFEHVGPGRLRVWRAAKPGHLWDTSDGTARWTVKGDPVIYASCTAGLAVLEAVAHLKRVDGPRPHRLGHVEIDVHANDVWMVRVETLPRQWKRSKATTRRLGQAWLAAKGAALLLVPSALVAGEMNALIDATSPQWRRWRAGCSDSAFRFDRRLR